MEEKYIPVHSNPQSFTYFSFLFVVVGIITFLLGVVRLIYRQDPSLFNDHGSVFTTMIIVSGSTVVAASGILILASFLLRSWMKDIHYTILKTIGSFSALILVMSLGAVVFVPPGDLNWIAYTLLCVTFCGFLYLYSLIWKVACAYHEEKHFNTYPVHWSFLLIILVPFSIISVPFFSRNLCWPIMCVSFSIIVSSFIAVIRFSGQEVCNSEHLEQDKAVDHP